MNPMGEHNGRNELGYFAPGNTIARGNPANKRMAELRRVLLEAATPDDIRAVYGAMLAAAKSGDVQAARLLWDYLIGRPTQALTITADGETLHKILKVPIGQRLRRPEGQGDVNGEVKGEAPGG